jgi:predicted amidohydrolase
LAGDYDMIVVVANWPDSRQQAWRYLTHARAIENQCYLVGCNRVGDDRFCHYTGESLVCDSKGDTLLLLGDKEEAKSVELDFASLQYVREHFRVLNDRDK